MTSCNIARYVSSFSELKQQALKGKGDTVSGKEYKRVIVPVINKFYKGAKIENLDDLKLRRVHAEMKLGKYDVLFYKYAINTERMRLSKQNINEKGELIISKKEVQEALLQDVKDLVDLFQTDRKKLSQTNTIFQYSEHVKKLFLLANIYTKGAEMINSIFYIENVVIPFKYASITVINNQIVRLSMFICLRILEMIMEIDVDTRKIKSIKTITPCYIPATYLTTV